MFSKQVLLFVSALLATSASAHMHMLDPPALAAKENSFTQNADYSYDSPLNPSGSDFPCKGKLDLLSGGEGKAVAEWAAGSQQKFTINPPGARHDGGSCQASLSEDGGATWKVLKSYIGNCPSVDGGEFGFTVPAEAKAGDAVFAWTWFNKVGNREMYMNCAAVTITGGSGGGLSALPDMFVANVGNGCKSNAEGTGDLEFPNPGKDVQKDSTKTAPPEGTCGSGSDAPAPDAPAPDTPAPDTPAPDTPAPDTPVPTTTGGSDAPSQTFDDGQYHPPTLMPEVSTSDVPVPEATGLSEVSPQPTNVEDGGDSTDPEDPEVPEVPPPASGGQVYDIVMVIDGKTQTGKATLSVPTAAARARRHVRHFRA